MKYRLKNITLKENRCGATFCYGVCETREKEGGSQSCLVVGKNVDVGDGFIAVEVPEGIIYRRLG